MAKSPGRAVGTRTVTGLVESEWKRWCGGRLVVKDESVRELWLMRLDMGEGGVDDRVLRRAMFEEWDMWHHTMKIRGDVVEELGRKALEWRLPVRARMQIGWAGLAAMTMDMVGRGWVEW